MKFARCSNSSIKGRYKMYFRIILCFLLFNFSSVLAADKNNLDIYELEVFATRMQQTDKEVGSSYFVITGEEIKNLGIKFALDAISLSPGITTNQNGSFGGLATVRIRGADSEQTLVLIDGIAVNDTSSPGGGFDFSRLNTENIEKIEILRGPQSTLWGTDAIGGVVSITSKKQRENINRTFYSEFGSYNTLRTGGSLGINSNGSQFRLFANGIYSDGISKADSENGNTENDPYKSFTIGGNNKITLSENINTSSSVQWTKTDTDFDNFGPTDGEISTKSNELNGNILFDLTINNQIKNYLTFGYAKISRDNFNRSEKSFESSGDRLNFRYQGDLILNDKQKVILGIEREETKANKSNASINSFFTLHEFKPFINFTMTSGFRSDNHNIFGSEETVRFAGAYNIKDSIKITASWGEGFKVPTIFQSTYICNFCGLSEPNKNLKPEKSKSWDIGFYFNNINSFSEFGIVYFHLKTDDEIGFSFTEGYDNIDEVISKGFELFGSAQINKKINISANYSFINAKEIQNPNVISKPRIRVPKHSGNIILSYSPTDKVNTSLILLYNGREYDSFSEVKKWFRFDISGSYELKESIELYAKVENLLNKKYQQISGYGTQNFSGLLGLRLRI